MGCNEAKGNLGIDHIVYIYDMRKLNKHFKEDRAQCVEMLVKVQGPHRFVVSNKEEGIFFTIDL